MRGGAAIQRKPGMAQQHSRFYHAGEAPAPIRALLAESAREEILEANLPNPAAAVAWRFATARVPLSVGQAPGRRVHRARAFPGTTLGDAAQRCASGREDFDDATAPLRHRPGACCSRELATIRATSAAPEARRTGTKAARVRPRIRPDAPHRRLCPDDDEVITRPTARRKKPSGRDVRARRILPGFSRLLTRDAQTALAAKESWFEREGCRNCGEGQSRRMQ